MLPHFAAAIMLAVSCPPGMHDFSRHLCKLVYSMYASAVVVTLPLIMSGDVELNPSPKQTTAPSLESISNTLSQLEASRGTLLSEVTLIRAAQSNIELLVNNLSTRVDALEKRAESNVHSVSESAFSSPNAEISKLTAEVKTLAEKCDDSENRLRRPYPLFFGIPDVNGESWTQSESQVVSFCATKLGITINSSDVERAHRLGHFQVGKNCPIIAKFSRFA